MVTKISFDPCVHTSQMIVKTMLLEKKKDLVGYGPPLNICKLLNKTNKNQSNNRKNCSFTILVMRLTSEQLNGPTNDQYSD